MFKDQQVGQRAGSYAIRNQRVADNVYTPIVGTYSVNPNQPVLPSSANNPALDAFARRRMSAPVTVFDAKQIVDNLPLFFDDQEIAGGGTGSSYSANRASSTMTTTADTAGTRARQTFRRFNYQPGKSQFGAFTFVPGTGDNLKRCGLFDENNGVFFSFQNETAYVGYRSNISGSPATFEFAQSEWNLDPLDGTGPSGITLDLNQSQLAFIDFEWLGVGSIAYGFFIDRVPVYVHFVHNANRSSGVYMSTPNLPVRYEIINDGTGAADSFEVICSTVISEGGQQDTGILRTVDRLISPFVTANDTNIYPLVSIRLKSTHQGITVFPTQVSAACTTTADFRVMLLLNPTFANAGTNDTYTALANSAIEHNVIRTNTNTLSGGTLLFSAYVTQTATNRDALAAIPENVLTLGANIAGTSDVLVLAVQNLSAGVENYYASINFRELL